MHYVLPDMSLISTNRQLIRLARLAGFNLPKGNTRAETISDAENTIINLMYNDVVLCQINIDCNYNNNNQRMKKMKIENYEYMAKSNTGENFFRFSKSFRTFQELESWTIQKNILTPEKTELWQEWQQYKPQGRVQDGYIIDKYNDNDINIIVRYCRDTNTYQIYGFQKI